MLLRPPLRWSPMTRLAGICAFSILSMLLLGSQTSYYTYLTTVEEIDEWKGRKTENSAIARHFIAHPVPAAEFGELGQRAALLTQWMEEWGDHSPPPKTSDARFDFPTPYTPENYTVVLEDLAVSMFPFIKKGGRRVEVLEPLRTLRKRYKNGRPIGIVIPTSIESFRFACHLVLNLRTVLHSQLPIEIVYAGDASLPFEYRRAMKAMERMDLDFVDIFDVLENKYMGLDHESGSAMKPFALLASTFSTVIMIDPDTVFMQKPEMVFYGSRAYQETGTLLFHDRLVERGEHESRHQWWQHQMRQHEPSEMFQKSVTMLEGYGQEADSGVVLMDKGKLGVLMGLLHACWQNSKEIREKETYAHVKGDKETYWLGLELTGTTYAFSEYYGAAIGKWESGGVRGSQVAHVDDSKKLLWFNGSLLKNKAGGTNVREYFAPTKWMMDGTWTLEDDFMASMSGAKELDLSTTEKAVIEESVDAAMKIDQQLEKLLGLPAIDAAVPVGNTTISFLMSRSRI